MDFAEGVEPSFPNAPRTLRTVSESTQLTLYGVLPLDDAKMEPLGGIEPPTSDLRDWRSATELQGHGGRSGIRTRDLSGDRGAP